MLAFEKEMEAKDEIIFVLNRKLEAIYEDAKNQSED